MGPGDTARAGEQVSLPPVSLGGAVLSPRGPQPLMVSASFSSEAAGRQHERACWGLLLKGASDGVRTRPRAGFLVVAAQLPWAGFVLFCFSGCTHGTWMFWGRGLMVGLSCYVCLSCRNTGSLTHGAGPGIEPALQPRPCQIHNPLHHSGNSRVVFCFVLFCF